MVRKLLLILVILLSATGVLLILTTTVIDRTPYKETGFYREMDRRLDSLYEATSQLPGTGSLRIGWSTVNITPSDPVPLAGYGNRRPKTSAGIHDSSFVRSVVFEMGGKKAALVTADLLIIHPEISRRVWKLLSPEWSAEEIYFTATHTHSGPGGWAPGIIGKLFAGPYDPKIADQLAEKIAVSIRLAAVNTTAGSLSFIEFSVDNLVTNRLAKEKGTIDPWLKVLQIQNKSGRGFISFFSAHTTCFGHEFRKLSGDYPAALITSLEQDSSIQFAAFGAGAVGSMGPNVARKNDLEEVQQMAAALHEQIALFDLLGSPPLPPAPLHTYQLRVPLRAPYFKVTKHLALRPYLFNQIGGTYQNHIRVMQIGSVLMIGMPCDFSGELAEPLYRVAREKGLHLIITSFNGEYMGYVIKDKWYDLPKYEAKTMSWYGPDTGSYFSEIITRIIDATGNN